MIAVAGLQRDTIRLRRVQSLCSSVPLHRVHTEWQLSLSDVHSFMMEKLAQPGRLHAHPLHLYLPSRTKLWLALQMRRQIRSPVSTLPLYMYSVYPSVAHQQELLTALCPPL